MSGQGASQRVSRGMKLLDERLGAGWEQKINLASLDLEDCSHCILGHLYGEFTLGCEELGFAILDDVVEAYGFDITSGEDEWDALNAEWHRALRERIGGLP